MEARRPYTQVIDGVRRCPFLHPEIFRASLTFRAADGDVVQVSYPRSGTHWVQYITQLILNGCEPISTRAEFGRNMRFIEYMKATEWTPTLPMRTYLTHLPLRQETMNENAKYVYVARNPWDVCVSQFHMVTNLSICRFQDGAFGEFFDAFIDGEVGFGSNFDHLASGYALRDEPNVFFVTYEELKKDTRGTVLRLAYFLNESYGGTLEKDEELLWKILEWSKPEYMRKVMIMDFQSLQIGEFKETCVKNRVSCKQGYEGDKTKYSYLREAKMGGWKDYFTPNQLARFEKKMQDEGDRALFMELWKDIRDEAIAMSGISA